MTTIVKIICLRDDYTIYGRNNYKQPIVLACMVENKYSQISLPKTIIEQIDLEISTSIDGYRSRAEFVAEAVRQKLSQKVEVKK